MKNELKEDEGAMGKTNYEMIKFLLPDALGRVSKCFNYGKCKGHLKKEEMEQQIDEVIYSLGQEVWLDLNKMYTFEGNKQWENRLKKHEVVELITNIVHKVLNSFFGSKNTYGLDS